MAEPIQTFETKIAGLQHENPDGSSRRELTTGLRVGDPLVLMREPTNPHDPNAVAVFTKDRKQIGYLRAHVAANLVEDMQDGLVPRARVYRIDRNPDDGKPDSIILTIDLEETEDGAPARIEAEGGIAVSSRSAVAKRRRFLIVALGFILFVSGSGGCIHGLAQTHEARGLVAFSMIGSLLGLFFLAASALCKWMNAE